MAFAGIKSRFGSLGDLQPSILPPGFLNYIVVRERKEEEGKGGGGDSNFNRSLLKKQ